MVVYLQDLKSSDWYNSIVDLPDGVNEMDEDLLLLWKQNANFDALFMTEIDCNSSSPGQWSAKKNSPSTGLKPYTRNNNTPTRLFDKPI